MMTFRRTTNLYQYFWILFVVVVGIAHPTNAQELEEKVLPLNGQIAPDGSTFQLDWFDTPRARIGAAMIDRRDLGKVGPDTWEQIAPPVTAGFKYVDDTIEPGVAYEYRVIRAGRDIIDVGFWTTGVLIPAKETRGHAHLVVDETLAAGLALHLNRFENDLIGDGWTVSRLDAPRGVGGTRIENLQKAIGIKTWLHEQHANDPMGNHVVILIGRIPFIKSGMVNPDGHDPRPHATDLFYGDVDGQWAINQDGKLLNNSLPSDFIEMQVGRIDLSPVSDNDIDKELHQMRAYFDKNHHWRMGFHGDLNEAYGSENHFAVEQTGLRNIVGPENLTIGRHKNVGEERPWLWGVDFGHWNGREYADTFENKAVFTINFGSAKQRIESPYNGMTALLAQPWYPIATGWGARPSWWLHHMALGGTIGDAHMRTVNNGIAAEPYRDSMDYFPTGTYLWRNPIWVNLLGDPTTHAFGLSPPTGFGAQEAQDGIVLEWAASPDQGILGYRVYRAVGNNAFVAIDDDNVITRTTFTDTAPVENARYMVRAYGLKEAYAGSFYTLSQGVFADVGATPLAPETLDIKGAPGQDVPLPMIKEDPSSGLIRAFIAGPETGDLRFDGDQWIYTAPAEFSGKISLPFTVSNGLQTAAGTVNINVEG